MMNLNSLFQKRLNLYMKKMIKYTKIIVNDHFVLLLFLILGIGGYSYTNYLDTLQMQMIFPRVIVFLLYYMYTTTGEITLLIESADQIFLLPKEDEYKEIFKKALMVSYIKTVFSTVLLLIITFPIFVKTVNIQKYTTIWIFITLMSLKWFNLLVKIFPFFYQNKRKYQCYKFLAQILILFSLFSLTFLNIEMISIFCLFLTIALMYLFYTERIYFSHTFKWQEMIEMEEKRVQKLYRIIQLFTDVPNIKTRISRLKGLDELLNRLSAKHLDPSFYYLLRLFFRNTDYSFLIIRLFLTGSILIALTKNFVLANILAVLFIYMLGYQLLSLKNEINSIPQFHFYPISDKHINNSILYIIKNILYIFSFILSISSLYSLGLVGLLLFPICLIFTNMFVSFYLSTKIKTEKH